MEQPLWMNYIKPRNSNLTNRNASIITNKTQAQTIFTGYTKQIGDINTGLKTTIHPRVFNGDNGLTVTNLKNGDTWSNPKAINSAQYPSRLPIVPPTYDYTEKINVSKLYDLGEQFNFNLYPALKRFDASFSKIQTLADIPRQLESIDLSYTSITSFPVPTNTNDKLVYIDLSNTSIVDIPDLSPLVNLQTLYISNIPKLTTLQVEQQRTLAVLDISNTGITDVSNIILPSLIELNASNNNIETINTVQESIQNLFLTDTSITVLPEMPDNLRSLYIDGTNICALPSILPSKLIDLNIARTKIDSLPTLPSGLLSLDITTTNITSVPTLPSTLLQLYMTDITINNIEDVFNNLKLLKKLELFNISATNITTIPFLPPSLLYLNISNINITVVPDLPSGLLELNISNTSINEITIIPNTLQILDISDNNISSLPNLPNTILNLDVSRCYINQETADLIATNIYNNNLYNGILFIQEQRDNDDNIIILNTTSEIWNNLRNPPYNWLIDKLD
jgi:Leucine-rich repeat (LRR) protein